jgi:hypothetical protein
MVQQFQTLKHCVAGDAEAETVAYKSNMQKFTFINITVNRHEMVLAVVYIFFVWVSAVVLFFSELLGHVFYENRLSVIFW